MVFTCYNTLIAGKCQVNRKSIFMIEIVPGPYIANARVLFHQPFS